MFSNLCEENESEILYSIEFPEFHSIKGLFLRHEKNYFNICDTQSAEKINIYRYGTGTRYSTVVATNN